MSDKTKIEWTDATWNPVSGCTLVSPGCDHCYAERIAERFRGVPGHYYEHGFDVTLRPDKLSDPLRWKRPRRIFVNSMSDLFHKDVPDEYIAKVFAVMQEAKQHVFQVLTKRPERMKRFLSRGILPDVMPKMHHIWLGTSVENADYAWRADMLRATPAAVRFLSLEPLLGHIPALVLRDMDWVIVGGESGPGARELNPDWVRDIRDDCAAMSIPFFFKQWGGVRDKRGHDDAVIDGVRHIEFPLIGAPA